MNNPTKGGRFYRDPATDELSSEPPAPAPEPVAPAASTKAAKAGTDQPPVAGDIAPEQKDQTI